MSKRALIAVTSHDQLGDLRKTGYYLPELAHPFLALHDAGYDVDVVSPRGGMAPMDPNSFDLDDADNRRFWQTPEMRGKVENTRQPEEVRHTDYEAVVFAGGHGVMWDFPHNQELQEIAAAIYERGGVVAAVCHGPAALVNLRLSDGAYLVDGKNVSAFTDEEEAAVGLTDVVPFLLASALIERGAKHIKAANFNPQVVVDGRLVTGQNPASAKPMGDQVVNLLKSGQRQTV